jgi:hypothetical protein
MRDGVKKRVETHVLVASACCASFVGVVLVFE